MKKQYVAIEFMDHSYGHPAESGLIPCEVVGLLVFEDKEEYRVASWVCDSEVDNQNNEIFSIGKGMVKKVRKLK